MKLKNKLLLANTKTRDKEKYLRGREREIILFEASARALKAAGIRCRQAEHRQHPVPQSWAGAGQSLVASLTFAHYFQTI